MTKSILNFHFDYLNASLNHNHYQHQSKRSDHQVPLDSQGYRQHLVKLKSTTFVSTSRFQVVIAKSPSPVIVLNIDTSTCYHQVPLTPSNRNNTECDKKIRFVIRCAINLIWKQNIKKPINEPYIFHFVLTSTNRLKDPKNSRVESQATTYREET